MDRVENFVSWTDWEAFSGLHDLTFIDSDRIQPAATQSRSRDDNDTTGG